MKRDIKDLKLMANAVRILSVDMVAKANSGHPGLPLGFADIATVLFTEVMKYNSKNPKWFDRDRFVLSAGHGSAMLYSLLYLTGYEDINVEDLKNFRQLHSKTAGHPEYGFLKGIETTTGPLGQGLTNAVGMAIAEKMAEARYGKDLVNHKIYCVVGDGDLMEGASYEALGVAATLNLNNLVVLWDNNSITIDGSTTLSRNEDMKMRVESNGFKFIEADGHDFESIRSAFDVANLSMQPTFIAFKTKIGYGSAKECTSKCHGSPIKGEELDALKKNLGWILPPFEVPSDTLLDWNNAGVRGEGEYSAWNNRLLKSDKRQDFINFIERKLPEGWKGSLAKMKKDVFAEKPNEATRKSSQRVLEVLTEAIPQMIGGSADLTPSNLTQTIATKQIITKNDFNGRYIEYGIRELGMAGIVNGIYLHSGFIPYGGTFLSFVDYEKPALRLAAIMGLSIIQVLTHDSIGVGEDGPTHQPIEQLASLRATPNLNVFRPCNIQETIECYELALESERTPNMMILSRQNVVFSSKESAENKSAKGMYIFNDCQGTPDVIIIATGTEIDLAITTKAELEKKNLKVRVVSAPCWSLFDKQLPEYKKSVLGGESILKVAIEAGCNMGWEKYIGQNGLFCGIPDDRFGMSGPAEKVYEYFGLTAEKISEKILKRLK
ncbi:MAG: transketolase [Rickettsiales bacterium]|nr:transketolase [Rickettsiales bacterium]